MSHARNEADLQCASITDMRMEWKPNFKEGRKQPILNIKENKNIKIYLDTLTSHQFFSFPNTRL